MKLACNLVKRKDYLVIYTMSNVLEAEGHEDFIIDSEFEFGEDCKTFEDFYNIYFCQDKDVWGLDLPNYFINMEKYNKDEPCFEFFDVKKSSIYLSYVRRTSINEKIQETGLNTASENKKHRKALKFIINYLAEKDPLILENLDILEFLGLDITINNYTGLIKKDY